MRSRSSSSLSRREFPSSRRFVVLDSPLSLPLSLRLLLRLFSVFSSPRRLPLDLSEPDSEPESEPDPESEPEDEEDPDEDEEEEELDEMEERRDFFSVVVRLSAFAARIEAAVPVLCRKECQYRCCGSYGMAGDVLWGENVLESGIHCTRREFCFELGVLKNCGTSRSSLVDPNSEDQSENWKKCNRD